MSVFEARDGDSVPIQNTQTERRRKANFLRQNQGSGKGVGLAESWMPHRNEVSHFCHTIIPGVVLIVSG